MQLKSILKTLNQKMFYIFLLLALALWFINKLNNTYIADVNIPVELVSDYSSDVRIHESGLTVNAAVQAKGSLLLLYRVGLGSAIQVPVNLLVVERKSGDVGDKYLHSIEPSSLVSALSKTQKDLVVLQVNNNDMVVRISSVRKKRVAIEPRIHVDCMRQYMQVGPIKLSQDSVEIKAPEIILDTLDKIPTKVLNLTGLRHQAAGSVGLIIPEGVMAQRTKVEYVVDVAGYTEIEYRVFVNTEHLPDSLRCYLAPSQVKILTNVPLRALGYIGTMREPVAFVDYNELAANLGPTLRVQVDSLSYGMRVKEVIPAFVEPFFEIVK